VFRERGKYLLRKTDIRNPLPSLLLLLQALFQAGFSAASCVEADGSTELAPVVVVLIRDQSERIAHVYFLLCFA
jgi:hypothetical protein